MSLQLTTQSSKRYAKEICLYQYHKCFPWVSISDYTG